MMMNKNIPAFTPVVDAYRSLMSVYSSCSRNTMKVPTESDDSKDKEDPKKYIKHCEMVINDFNEKIQTLEKKFGFNMTNKMHTIDGHIIDQITMTGRTLGSTDDQVIEACHQDLNKGQDKKYF